VSQIQQLYDGPNKLEDPFWSLRRKVISPLVEVDNPETETNGTQVTKISNIYLNLQRPHTFFIFLSWKSNITLSIGLADPSIKL